MPVDWPRYKTLCDRPDVLSRWMLERTLALLEIEGVDLAIAECLRAILETEPLPRPVGHSGPAATDMFVARLEADLAHATLAAVERAAAEGRLAQALGQRSQVGYLAAWREYAAFLAAAPAGPSVIC